MRVKDTRDKLMCLAAPYFWVNQSHQWHYMKMTGLIWTAQWRDDVISHLPSVLIEEQIIKEKAKRCTQQTTSTSHVIHNFCKSACVCVIVGAIPSRKTSPARSCSFPTAHGCSPPDDLEPSPDEEASRSEIIHFN